MELRILAALGVMFFIPGAAFLSCCGSWKCYHGMQRILMIVGVSIAFYPLLFYFLSITPTALTLGPYKASFVLLCCLAVTGYKLGYKLQILPRIEPFEWIALLLVAIILFIRFWVAYQYPYPAWTDSVHHVMLTKLIAVNGRLPATLDPYYPIPLEMYHLGLHSIAATTAWLSQVPFVSALLWTAQALNGLSVIGVYLVLDRKVGRFAALIGIAVVGIFSYQPAFYINWGRFTQVAAQALLLIAWLSFDDAIEHWFSLSSRTEVDSSAIGKSILSSVLVSGMLLIHFRVAAFFVLLILPTIVSVVWRYRQQHEKLMWGGIGLSVITILVLLMVAPAFFSALIAYAKHATSSLPAVIDQKQTQQSHALYYDTPLPAILTLIAQNWLLVVTMIAIIIGIAARSRLVILNVVWIMLLCGLGNLYRLGIRPLNVVNFSGTVIMFYLPISLIIGSAFQVLVDCVSPKIRGKVAWIVIAIVLAAALPATKQRLTQIQPERFFMTNSDLEAMNWIRENVPENARFAVNTYFWLPTVAYGTDAGYWIPYFAERKITAGSMLMNLGNQAYQTEVVTLSRMVVQLSRDNSSLHSLFEHGVEYIYIGANGDPSGKVLNVEQLRLSSEVQVIYELNGVTILKILG